MYCTYMYLAIVCKIFAKYCSVSLTGTQVVVTTFVIKIFENNLLILFFRCPNTTCRTTKAQCERVSRIIRVQNCHYNADLVT